MSTNNATFKKLINNDVEQNQNVHVQQPVYDRYPATVGSPGFSQGIYPTQTPPACYVDYATQPSQMIQYTQPTIVNFVNEEKNRREIQKHCNQQLLLLRIRQVATSFYNAPTPLIPPLGASALPTRLPDGLFQATQYLSVNNLFSEVSLAISILVSSAIATCGRITIDCGYGWQERTPLMLIQSAESGSRKSSVTDKLRSPFDTYYDNKLLNFEEYATERKADTQIQKLITKNIERKMSAIIKDNGNNITPCVIQRLKECSMQNEKLLSSSKSKEIHPQHLLIDNVTPTGFRKHLQANGQASGSITSENDVLKSMLLKSNSDRALFNKVYNQETYHIQTAREHILLECPAYSTINFIQLEIIRKIFTNKELNEIGVTARFLPYFHYEQNVSISTPCTRLPEHSSKESYNAHIDKLINLYYTQEVKPRQYTVKLSPLAQQCISNFISNVRTTIKPTMPQESHSALQKLHGQAVRLAWAIHTWNYDIPHEHDITDVEIYQAIQLCYALLPHISFAYSPLGITAYNNARIIIKNLQEININLDNKELQDGYIKSRTIQQRTHLEAHEVANALKVLEQHGWVRVIDNGKQHNIVVLHPDFNMWELY